MTEIKAIISDLGRVLVDFDNWIFLRKMEDFSPLTAEQMMERVRADLSILQDFERGTNTPDQFYERAARLFEAGPKKLEKAAFFRIYNDIFSLNHEAVEVLKGFRKHYRMVLLSNTDVMRYGYIIKAFPEILFFDDYVLSYLVGSIKPERNIFEVALKAAGENAEACLFIDDLEVNISAAERMGLRVLHMRPETDISSVLAEMGLRG